MIIEVKEKGSEEFYREVVSVSAMYRKLIKKPERKYVNYFRYYVLLTVVYVLLIAALLAMGFSWGFDAMRVVGLSVCSFGIVLCIVMLGSMNKLLKTYLNETPGSVVELNDDGIRYSHSGTEYKMSWENLAFVRTFKESLCFIGNEQCRIVISLTKEYQAQVLEYLSENGHGVKIIK